MQGTRFDTKTKSNKAIYTSVHPIISKYSRYKITKNNDGLLTDDSLFAKISISGDITANNIKLTFENKSSDWGDFVKVFDSRNQTMDVNNSYSNPVLAALAMKK